MTYSVKEIFYTLQGEGKHAGRPAVFLRFAGCNLWSGREADRANAACTFCDTDFVGTDGPGGGKFARATELADAVFRTWPVTGEASQRRFVVCTGGEPTLQLDRELIDALHSHDFEIAIETNGTKAVPADVDWICVSPKGKNPVVQTEGDELKLVFPQADAMPERFVSLDFRHFLLSPMDGAEVEQNTAAAVAYCLAHPRWSLSLQTHKLLHIP